MAIVTATGSRTRSMLAPIRRRISTSSRTRTVAPTPTTTATASQTQSTSVRWWPRTSDGYQDEDGCPDPDNDSDGILDVEDLCPNEKETLNGYADLDGCPDAEQIRVVGEKIVLDEQVLFETNLSEIRPESHKLLERLVKLLNEHPEYVTVSVDGHTDERGSEELNQRLSEERAKSVMNFLVAHGVSANRLTARGLGASQPRIQRSDPLAYTLNRRVEFHVTRQHAVGQSGPGAPSGTTASPACRGGEAMKTSVLLCALAAAFAAQSHRRLLRNRPRRWQMRSAAGASVRALPGFMPGGTQRVLWPVRRSRARRGSLRQLRHRLRRARVLSRR